MTAKEIVREVICLLQGGKRWTQGNIAKTPSNKWANAMDPDAAEAMLWAVAVASPGTWKVGNMNAPMMATIENTKYTIPARWAVAFIEFMPCLQGFGFRGPDPTLSAVLIPLTLPNSHVTIGSRN